MRNKHIFLLLLVPLSEAKALFYNSNLKVRYSLWINDTKYLCNVVEMYSNILIFSFIFWYFAFSKQDIISRKIFLGLFILNILDFIHFGIMDLPFFVLPKIVLAFFISWLWLKLRPLSNF